MADCTIPADGVLDDSITCVTGDYGLSSNSDDLFLRLTSDGVRVTSTGSNKVKFTSDATPYLNYVYPSSGTGGRRVLLQGTHRLADRGDGGLDMGDVRHLKIGSDICNMFDVTQPDDTSQLVCDQSSFQEAGHYNIEEDIKSKGIADNHFRLKRTSFNKTANHQYTVMPNIKTVNSTSGSTNGNILQITGTGFSDKNANNLVKVANTPCNIVSSSLTEIVCELQSEVTGNSTILPTNTSSSQTDGYH